MHWLKQKLYLSRVKLKARVGLAAAGKSRDEINALVDSIDNDMIELAKMKAGVGESGPDWDAPPGVSAPGDHPILEFIERFLNSELGQAIMKALLALLLAA